MIPILYYLCPVFFKPVTNVVMRKIILVSFCLIFVGLAPMVSAQDDAGSTSTTSTAKSGRPDLPGDLVIDIGFNFLLNNDTTLNSGFWGSKIINIYYFRQAPIGKSPFSINFGIGFGLEKLRFDENQTFQIDTNGNTAIVNLPTGIDVKKSKIAANFIDIPLEVRYHFNKENKSSGFMVGVGGKIGYLFSSHTKVKFKQDGETKTTKFHESYNLNKFRYGLTARVGSPGISAFGYYNLNKLFEDGKGPSNDMSTWNVGLTISGF